MNTHDPIFAAIDNHRQAEAAFVAACHAEHGEDDLSKASWKRLTELLTMTPTTVGGCAAMLRHVAGYAAAYNQNLLEGYRADLKEPAGTLLVRLAAVLENPAA